MTSDETDSISRYNLDDDGDDAGIPQRSYWWSLHRPETYALVAFALAAGTLISIGGAQELFQSVLLNLGSTNSEKPLVYTLSGIRLGVAVLAILAAVISIRAEDDDTTWSPPFARAAILVATLSALLSAASLILTANASTSPDNGGF
jgi:hypothetical protein